MTDSADLTSVDSSSEMTRGSVAMTASTVINDALLLAKDSGHRFGNFQSYYKFNPPSNRLDVLHELGIFQYLQQQQQSHIERPRTTSEIGCSRIGDVGKLVFRYGDVGCNEGDLTIDMANQLYQTLSSGNKPSIEFSGFDIDSGLIARATHKCNTLQDGEISGTFQVGTAQGLVIPPKDRRFDLMSLFSTTMWIHIHGGDDGLRMAIKRICECTKQYILIEPQPSKCYRNAMIRLRKMSQTEIDVSFERLTLRENIEEEIENMLNLNSFYRVPTHVELDDTKSDHFSKNKRTKWNRTLQLYKRKVDVATSQDRLIGVPASVDKGVSLPLEAS